MVTSYTQYSDAELLVLLRSADQAAFTELYSRYWEQMVTVARVKLDTVADAKEVVQEVFFELWRRKENLHVQQNFGAYLAGAIKYKILTHFARQYRRTVQESAAAAGIIDTGTEDYLSYADLKAELETSVAGLPEKCRLVYRLSREQGLSLREIAEALQIAPKTAEAHLSKALRTLRGKLKQFSCFA